MVRLLLILILFMGRAAASPLDLSLEAWDLKVADDPLVVQEEIESSWSELSLEKQPALYLRVLSVDCQVRAQIGSPFRDEHVIQSALVQARILAAWDEVIMLTSCAARSQIKVGHLKEGMALMEEAIDLARTHGRNSLHIRLLVLRSNLHMSQNESREALLLLQKAKGILEADQGVSQLERERLAVEIAMGLEATGTQNVGIEIYENALQYFMKAGLRSYQVIMHYNMAESYAAVSVIKNLDKARFHFEAAAGLAQTLRDEMTYVYALTGIAKVEFQLKNYAAAEALMQKAIDAFQDKDMTWWAESLMTLAAIKKEQGLEADALAILKKADAIVPASEKSLRRSLHVSMEEVSVKLGLYQEAYALRKELSEQQIEALKSKDAQEYSKVKVDLGLDVEEQRAMLLKQVNDRQTMATMVLAALILVLGVAIVWLKRQHDRIESMQKHIQENVLQRFLPPRIIESILSGQSPLDDAAQETTVTILFCDLVDFTSSSERLGADRIARVLNQFFKEMTDEIFETGGTIDKFIGDAIMVLFGAPIHAEPDVQAQKAIECAERILLRMESLNERWRRDEDVEFAIRIGVHQGQAIVGSFGSQKRSDFTAIGLHVNVAARIETIAQPNSITFSAAVAKHLPAASVHPLGLFRLRGVSEEWELFSRASPASKAPDHEAKTG